MKTRLNIYLSPGQHEEIAALSARRRVSKSSVIEAAVASMLSPDSADAREAAFVRRLDRHTRQLERVERDLAIAIETMALFVRFWLAVTPPLPESAQAAAKAKGAERYRDFVETLGRRLQRGNSLVREISLEIWPEQRSDGAGSAAPIDPDLGEGTSPMPAEPTPFSRSTRMLRTALGPDIGGYLADPDIVEVMLNPDGRLWIDRLSSGLEDTGRRISVLDGERIVRLVAHHVGAEAHAGSPRVSAELPETGERFEGLLPPVVMAPAFAIRKPAVAVFTLDDYVASCIMTSAQAVTLRTAVAERWNVLIAGGTSTGKTTLVNALLHEMVATGDRVVLIEDTRELQCMAPNLVAMRTEDGVASLTDLVRSSLLLRPDRIPIGEVRGREALDLLKAWGTGHPGGIGTIHASTAIGALRRLEQLVQEAVVTVSRPLIAETIDLIAVLAGRGAQRRLAGIWQVAELGPTGDYVVEPLGLDSFDTLTVIQGDKR